MQTYDVVMLVVLVATTIFGAIKGAAWQVASLSALVVSYVVALNFRDELAPMFGNERHHVFLAMLVLYVVTSLVIWMLFRMVAGFIDRLRLREFDRQLGALFGLLKGALLCTAITLFAITISERFCHAVMESHSGHYIARFIDKAHYVMPEEVHEVLDPYINHLDETLEHGHNHTHDGHQPPEGSGLSRAVDGLLGRSADPPSQPSSGGFGGLIDGLVGGSSAGDRSTSSEGNFLDRSRELLDGVDRFRDAGRDSYDALGDEANRLRREGGNVRSDLVDEAARFRDAFVPTERR